MLILWTTDDINKIVEYLSFVRVLLKRHLVQLITCKINAKFNRSKENIINVTCYYSTILSTNDSSNDIIERFKIKVTLVY